MAAVTVRLRSTAPSVLHTINPSGSTSASCRRTSFRAYASSTRAHEPPRTLPQVKKNLQPAPRPPKFSPFFNKPPPPRIPQPHHGIETVESFLESLRRPSLLALAPKFTTWDELFAVDGKTLLKDGTLAGARERRYLLRSMELFRHGLDPKSFSVGDRKPKKIRGWGPRVQHGKRLRGEPGGRVTI